MIGAVVQVATRPVSNDAIEVVWEINRTMPPDGRSMQSRAFAFAEKGNEEALRDRVFEIHAALDGIHFTKLGTVQGPGNKFVFRDARPGWLYHFKVVVLGKNEKKRLESSLVLGAAGPNLFREADFEGLELGTFGGEREAPEQCSFKEAEAFSVIKGARPYSDGEKILAWDPKKAKVKQASFYGIPVPLSPDKTYLQGGWVRAEKNAWFGRWFHDKQGEKTTFFSYVLMSLRDTPEWVFGVQKIEVDADGSAMRIVDGEARSMMLKAWKFPKNAGYIAPFVTGYDKGQLDDHWLVEVSQAPEGAAVVPTGQN